MSFLQITSDGPGLSRQLCKNPASGMTAWRLRKGVLAGWFSPSPQADDPRVYNLLFMDAFDDASFGRRRENEGAYYTADKLNSTLAVSSMIATALNTRLNKPDEHLPDDNMPDKCTYTVTVPTVRTRRQADDDPRPDRCVNLWGFLNSDAVHVRLDNDPKLGLGSLTVTGGSLHEVLCTTFIGCYLQAMVIHVADNRDTGAVAKAVWALNEVRAPYYPRYLLKARLPRQVVAEVADDLQAMPGHSLQMTYASNNVERIHNVLKMASGDWPLVDLGCGEGAYLTLAKAIPTRPYLAVDRDELCRAHVEAKAAAKGLTNITVHADLTEAITKLQGQPFMGIAVESLEHNPPEEATRLVDQMFAAGCVLLVVTVPNRLFNHWYGLPEGVLRNPGHVFEPDELELRALLGEGRRAVRVEPLGDVVDGESTAMLAVVTPLP